MCFYGNEMYYYYRIWTIALYGVRDVVCIGHGMIPGLDESCGAS